MMCAYHFQSENSGSCECTWHMPRLQDSTKFKKIKGFVPPPLTQEILEECLKSKKISTLRKNIHHLKLKIWVESKYTKDKKER